MFEKFDASLTTVIEKSNENLRKLLAHSEGLMSKLFKSTLLRMEALSNSFERAVRSMSADVTDSMSHLHTAMSTLSTSALWTVEQEKKDEERRANNVIISGLVQQPGVGDREVTTFSPRSGVAVWLPMMKPKYPSTPFCRILRAIVTSVIISNLFG
ncbi:hypothetical protein HELRODRAFT_168012 [Helobdella robusta]|uniref:Uncharacterized protein n=1 Tax=Helobdella robusta TaxID=6412 RepID=T1F024_HELRO|nr:hypothetical protein HELRODRAFT_168012 [Helobdella robusta]ESO10148.1 hypothetical protein HELRODRAFT_168012 [Helobdella robusta]